MYRFTAPVVFVRLSAGTATDLYKTRYKHQHPYEYCSSDVPKFVRSSDGKARTGFSNEYLYNVLQCIVAGLYSSHVMYN
jgi:hypothetical protein